VEDGTKKSNSGKSYADMCSRLTTSGSSVTTPSVVSDAKSTVRQSPTIGTKSIRKGGDEAGKAQSGIYVKNVPHNTDNTTMREVFGKFGEILQGDEGVNFAGRKMKNKVAGNESSFVFVNFLNADGAKKAVEAGAEEVFVINGQKVEVEIRNKQKKGGDKGDGRKSGNRSRTNRRDSDRRRQPRRGGDKTEKP